MSMFARSARMITRCNAGQRFWKAAQTISTRTISTPTMATSSKIQLSPSQELIFSVPGISSETADVTSELLQENHEQHHIFFNHAGFHVRCCWHNLIPGS